MHHLLEHINQDKKGDEAQINRVSQRLLKWKKALLEKSDVSCAKDKV